MTSSVFFHWFKLKLCLSSLFIIPSIINLLNLLSSFLAGFISCTNGLFWKFSLSSFSVIKQLLYPLMSMCCSTSLSFKMFLPLVLTFCSILLFHFLYVEVMELFKSILYQSLLSLYMLLVLSANVIVLSVRCSNHFYVVLKLFLKTIFLLFKFYVLCWSNQVLFKQYEFVHFSRAYCWS